jgi:ADP-heptose:LPS heptosyltransferase
MFKTLVRLFLPNPFERMLKRAAKKGGERIFIEWNRGLGDIALGLYAMVHRIKEVIPDAKITFITRENLREGFSLLEGVETIVVPEWKRGEKTNVKEFVFSKKIAHDLLIEKPDPTQWVAWQRGKLVPKLKWDGAHEDLYKKFELPKGCVGVQVAAETGYGLWRNWPLEKWQELINCLEKKGVTVLLFGFGKEPLFTQKNVVDLRGKTTLFELISIIKNCCSSVVLPDSGISSMIYYLNTSFNIKQITLWADPDHGILKQQVASPNPKLIHSALIAKGKDLSTLGVDEVLKKIFSPLIHCKDAKSVAKRDVLNTGAILLAGGQGSRLGASFPKGLFSVADKTLFQWICEKIKKGPLAIMTSPLNHQETVAYFQKNDFFGLEIYFFQQEMRAFLDEDKKIMRVEGPNGNGSVFRSFCRAGLDLVFAKKGIELVTVSYVDNPFTDPFDEALLSYAKETKAEVTLQCIEKMPSDQSMGALVEHGDKIEIIEYMEQDPLEEYRYVYSGQIVFDFSFFCKMAQKELPLHWVQKKHEGRSVWKGEEFIFDVFRYASSIKALAVSRETHYAPIKGLDTVESVEKLLKRKR